MSRSARHCCEFAQKLVPLCFSFGAAPRRPIGGLRASVASHRSAGERFDRLQGLARAGVARYTHFQLMESDSYPVRPGWLPALAALAPRGKAWVRGSLSRCIRPNEQAHVNGNAMYALSKEFVNTLRSEMLKRLDSWAFDVPPGCWLQPPPSA